MSILGGFQIAQQAVAQFAVLVQSHSDSMLIHFTQLCLSLTKNLHHETLIMNKHHSLICETSCFANGWITIVQQAVAQLVCIVDRAIGQQFVAQKVWL